MEAKYLGDGVYVQLNEANQVILTTGHHLPIEADQVIYLEPEVLNSLQKFIENLRVK